jgi:hypothetical protein
MTVGTFTDVEAAVKAWARAHAGISAAASGGVFLSIPKGAHFPLLVITRVGGAPELGEAPLDQARIQFDCWGSDRAGAAALSVEVVKGLVGLRDGDAMGPSAVGKGATVELGPVFQPDLESRRPRYVVDGLITVVGL